MDGLYNSHNVSTPAANRQFGRVSLDNNQAVRQETDWLTALASVASLE